MTQQQDNAQVVADEAKSTVTTEPKKRGPKPKAAESKEVEKVEESQKPETQQTDENAPQSDPKSLEEEKGDEQTANTSSSQVELETKSESGGANQVIGEQTNDVESVISKLTDDQTKLDVVSTPSSNENPFSPVADNLLNRYADQPAIINLIGMPIVENANNENIVVQEVDNVAVKSKNDLLIQVKNNGISTIFEPISKTSIKPGETVEIECTSRSVKQSVLNNIKQFNALGKKVEVLNHD